LCVKRQGHVERQGCAERMSGGGNATKPKGHAERMSDKGDATTSRTRGTGGDGTTRGDGAMRGGDSANGKRQHE
jgi:hypothetical protein